jgi:hypothetical protein
LVRSAKIDNAMTEPASPPNPTNVPKRSQPPVGRIPTRAERVRAACGKFAWIPFSSEDHIREKQEEIELEESKLCPPSPTPQQ